SSVRRVRRWPARTRVRTGRVVWGWRCSWCCLPLGSGSGTELARGQVLHDLFGAATDHHDLHLAVDALAGGAAHVAHAAQYLHGRVGVGLHGLGAVVLEQADVAHPIGAVVARVDAVAERVEPGL